MGIMPNSSNLSKTLAITLGEETHLCGKNCDDVHLKTSSSYTVIKKSFRADVAD